MILDLSLDELAALRRVLDRESGMPAGEAERKTLGPFSPAAPIPGSRFSKPSDPIPFLAIIKVTSAATGGGYYNGKAYGLNTTIWASSGNLSSTKIEGFSRGECIAINMGEVGTSNHDLTAAGNTNQKYFVGLQVGATTTYPYYLLIGNAAWFDTCPAARPGELSITPITEDAAIDDTMRDIYVDTTAGDVTLTAPLIATIGAYAYTIYVTGGNNAIFAPSGGQTAQGLATLTIASGDFQTITSPGIGTNWF